MRKKDFIEGDDFVEMDENKGSKSIIDLFSAHLKNNHDIDHDNVGDVLIPTGIDLLDAVLGGGICSGLSQWVGNPGCGKSALAAQIIANGEKLWPGKFISIYADSEEAMTTQRLKQLGVKEEIIPYNDMTVESIFRLIDGVCTFKEKERSLIEIPSVIVWDSVANTPPAGATEATDPNSVTGLKARIITHLLPNYVSKLKKYRITLLAINQLRDKIDIGVVKTPNDLAFMGNKKIPGGNSLLFNSRQLFLLKTAGDLKDLYGFAGTKVELKGIKNKFFKPNVKITTTFGYERGFSNFWTNFELLKETERISAGAWAYLNSYPEKKFRQAQAITEYETNPEFKRFFDEEVQNTLKSEYSIDDVVVSPKVEEEEIFSE